MRDRGNTVLVLVALGVSLFATFDDLLTGKNVPIYRDVLYFVLPFKHFLASHLRAGTLPLWNPFAFMGTPFLAGLQTGVLYPPSLLLLLPFPLGFGIFLFFHYLVAASGTWLWLRDRKLGAVASGVGSLVYVLGGFLVSMLNVTSFLQTAAWTPWILWRWSRFLDDRSRRSFLLLTVCLVLLVLGGSPEIALMTFGVLGLSIISIAWSSPSDASSVFAALSAAAALTGIVLAAQILPTLEYVAQSGRSAPLLPGEVMYWSMQPVSFLQLLFPHSSFFTGPGETDTVGRVLEERVPWIQSVYLGLVPLCLVTAGACCARDRVLWLFLIGAGVILALGKYTPVLPLLYQVAPGIFGRFRYPEKFYFLVHVGATVLAAQGVDNLLKGDAAGRRGAVVTGTVLLLVAVALCAIQAFWPDGFLRLVKALKGESWPLWVYAGHAIDLGSRARRAVWILGAFLALLELRRRSLLGTNVIAWAMLGLVATDLAAIHRHLNLTIPWSELQDTSPLVDVRELQETHQRLFHYQSLGEGKGIEQWDNPVREADNFREVALRSWPTLFLDVGMVYGISTAVGFDGIVPRAIQTLRRVLSIIPPDRATNLLGLYSVRYLIGPTPLTASSLERIPVGNSSPLYVYRVRDAMPLAYVVHRLKVAEADLDAFNALIAPSFQPTETAVVSSSPLDWEDKSIGGLPDSTVAIATFDDMHVAIDVTTREGGFLVLNQSYFPGWEAWIDDVPVPIVRTNVLVRGVPIGMGSHHVDFRYRPESFRWGLRISVLGVVLFIVLVIASSWSARSGRA